MLYTVVNGFDSDHKNYGYIRTHFEDYFKSFYKLIDFINWVIICYITVTTPHNIADILTYKPN